MIFHSIPYKRHNCNKESKSQHFSIPLANAYPSSIKFQLPIGEISFTISPKFLLTKARSSFQSSLIILLDSGDDGVGSCNDDSCYSSSLTFVFSQTITRNGLSVSTYGTPSAPLSIGFSYESSSSMKYLYSISNIPLQIQGSCILSESKPSS